MSFGRYLNSCTKGTDSSDKYSVRKSCTITMSSPESRKRKRNLSLEDKLSIIKEVERSTHETKTMIANRLKIPLSTLTSILLQREKIRDNASTVGVHANKRMRMREGHFAQLEAVLFEWFRQKRSENVSISGWMLQAKAADFCEQLNIPKSFAASSGWLQKFKIRYGITGRTACGESAALSDVYTADYWIQHNVPVLLEECALDHIYNFGETGLFYNLQPSKTLAERATGPCHRGTQSKQRITVLVGTNATGTDKLPLLVIGKSKKPRCFSGVKTLPTKYANNKTAWMTGNLFKSILQDLDTRMRREKRNILILLDNCTAHPKDLELTNIRLEFLPANCTSRLQPLDLGIIANLKVYYRKKLSQYIISILDNQVTSSQKVTLDILQAMTFVAAAWEAVDPNTIKKCWQKIGVKPSEGASIQSQEESSQDDEPTSEEPPGWSTVSQGVSFESFVNFDNDLAVCSSGTEEDIISQLQDTAESSEDESEQDEVPKIPTFKEAIAGFEVARRYIASKIIPEEALQIITSAEHILYETAARNDDRNEN